MVKRFNKDYFAPDGGTEISIESLSKTFRKKIEFLRDNLGIDFDDFAIRASREVGQPYSSGEIPSIESIFVEGTGPDGEEMVLLTGPAGDSYRTNLYIDGSPIAVNRIIREFTGRNFVASPSTPAYERRKARELEGRGSKSDLEAWRVRPR